MPITFVWSVKLEIPSVGRWGLLAAIDPRRKIKAGIHLLEGVTASVAHFMFARKGLGLVSFRKCTGENFISRFAKIAAATHLGLKNASKRIPNCIGNLTVIHIQAFRDYFDQSILE